MVLLWAAVALPSGACSFDTSATGAGPAGDDDEDGGGEPDEICPAELHAEISIGGQSPGSEPLSVLLGDTVELSAAGSCSRRGSLRFEWQLDEALVATAQPGLDGETLTVFPAVPGDYEVTLIVSDAEGSAEPITAAGIRAPAWVGAIDQADVRDVAASGGRIWMATGDGPFFIDLAEPEAGVQELNPIAGGFDISTDLSAVYSDGGDLVWFGRKSATSQVWRLLRAANTIEVVAFPLESALVEVRDITALGAGIMVATRDGVLAAPDNQTLGAPSPASDVFAATENAAGGWAGGDDLLRVPDGAPFSPFVDGNNKIRALAGDAEEVWVGSDDQGIALFDSADSTAQVFTLEQDGLPSDKIRGLAIDGADVWAATDKGVARYKRDRGLWITMDEAAGLEGLVDVKGVTVLQVEGRRTIAIAAGGGIATMGLPAD